MKYGQFCPIAKATEIIGERWTILIVREILMGACRFNELQRGLGSISTAVLTERLKSLSEQGLVVRRKASGKRGFEYHPSPSCKELLPIILSLGRWGLRYAQDNLSDEDYDVELLMLYLERTVNRDMLPGAETILRFEFTDFVEQPLWWLIVDDNGVDVCVKDPGRDVDVYFKSTVRNLTDVWLGHSSYPAALRSGALTMVGDRGLTRSVSKWLRCETFDHETNAPVAVK